MTDKFKELVAKWEARILHRLTIAENNPNRQEREVAEVTAEAFKLALNELKSALAAQAPAWESASPKPENVKWLIDASNQVISELGKQEHLDSDTFRWLCNAVGQIERDLRQSSQPAEPRDPAGKSVEVKP